MEQFKSSEIDYILNNHGLITAKEIAVNLNKNYSKVKREIKKLGLSTAIGKSNFSRKKRKYIYNDNFFSCLNINNSYWAGFIAADGYISIINSDNMFLSLMLSTKDLKHIELLNNCISPDKPIVFAKSNGFDVCSVKYQSKNIVRDLTNNFNITERKSLTLEPPNIIDTNLIDSFIIGYIDGDGCIMLKDKYTQIQIVGTKEMLLWIKNRCCVILDKKRGSISKKNNHYVLTYASKSAKDLIRYFYKYDVPKLDRKWILPKNEEINIGYHRMKKINQVDLYTGKIVNTFNSLKEASKTINGNSSSISQCLNGKLKSSGGYKWSFIKTMEDHAKETGEVDQEESN